MAYRDPLVAARAKLKQAHMRVDEIEERMTEEILSHLPPTLAETVRQFRLQVTSEPSDLPAVRDRIAVLRAYRATLDQVVKRAPKLERNFNRLPRTYPKRIKASRYQFPDIYSPPNIKLRDKVHACVREMDAEAELVDESKRYFDHQPDPYLVDAKFRVERTPLRLHLSTDVSEQPVNQSSFQYRAFLIYADYCLLARTRPSLPPFELYPQSWMDRVTTWLRRQRDQHVGHDEFDDAFVVDADDDAAQRLLTEDICEALLSLASIGEPHLTVKNGLARLEWREPNRSSHRPEVVGLKTASRALAMLRNAPPVKLLRKTKRKS